MSPIRMSKYICQTLEYLGKRELLIAIRLLDLKVYI